MPFAKWNLEPVFVNYPCGWQNGSTASTCHQQPRIVKHDSPKSVIDAGNKSNDDHHAQPQHGVHSMYQSLVLHRPPPLALPHAQPIDETHGAEKEKEAMPPATLILMRISQRTMVGLMRQMVALLGASDQMFNEISDATRVMVDRSVRLKARMITLARNIDKQHTIVRQTYPAIPDLMVYCNLPDSIHWHSESGMESSVLAATSRPASVQALYGRAHAVGDVRLSSRGSYPSFTGMIRKRVQAANRSRLSQAAAKKTSSSEFESSEVCAATKYEAQCGCYCGTCHPLEDHQANRSKNGDESCSDASPRQSSSASSLVTWSSVSSSVFEPSQMVASGHHHAAHRRSYPLTSACSGDYYLLDKTSAIDAFFRKNPIALEAYHVVNGQAKQRKPSSVCTCSCQAGWQSSPPPTHRASDRQTESDFPASVDVTVATDDQQPRTSKADARNSHSNSMATINTETSYWHWWLNSTTDSSVSMIKRLQQDGKGDDEEDMNKRWSTAVAMASSPLKPAKFDTETTDWLKENIETRRPESLVILSPRDTPTDVLLEKALTPLCNNHNVQLRHASPTKKQLDVLESGKSATMPRLKRRWSLFPLKRSKKSNENNSPTNGSPFKRFNLLRKSERSSFSATPMQAVPSQHQVSASTTALDDCMQPAAMGQEDAKLKQIVLISPDERLRLLADKYCNPVEIAIDVSGKTFTRMTRNRRSLIHAEFHISRHRVPERRSRSKSPAKCCHSQMVSPYAYGHVARAKQLNKSITTERGCQTEMADDNNNGGANQFESAVDVHQSSKDDQEGGEHGDYVVVMNARKHKQSMARHRNGGGGGRSSSGNWSAATSDLAQSSPASSLTGVRCSRIAFRAQCVSPLSLAACTPTQENVASSEEANNDNQPPTTSNDEVESVYSVDNDGYFTSMHTDSGLSFGTFTLKTTPGAAHNGKRAGNSMRKSTANRFERIQEEPSFSSENLDRWTQASQLSLCNRRAKASSKTSMCSAKNELGSNDSINSILSASDVTSIAVDGEQHEETDFDCSVSHCSHQHESPKRQWKLTKTNDKAGATIVEPKREAVAEKRKQHAQHARSIQRHHHRYLNRTLTESSSNSSSFRRLPPPPPPPRVSSMLVTLQRYVDEAAATAATLEKNKNNNKHTCSVVSSSTTLDAISQATSSSNAMDKQVNHRESQHQATNGSVYQSESETNSEYLQTSRRRLFLDVDSARSYPPLSFIASYDEQTDTATSVSATSSAVFFEDDQFEFGQLKASTSLKTQTKSEATDSSSTTIDAGGSSGTLTPVANSHTDTATNPSPVAAKSDADRHFSSPLPPPKLKSFTMDNRSMKRFSTESGRHEQPKENGESPPKPAPRNSLHLSLDEMNKILAQGPEPTGSAKQVRISPTVTAGEPVSCPKSASPKALSPADMLVLLHNAKKKHNIKTQPEKELAGLRSPTSAGAVNGNSRVTSGTSIDLKRRSWTGGNNFGSLGRDTSGEQTKHENVAGTRASLALDRLGPIRPTTLTDFKRLLSQVRSSPTSPPKPLSSTYSALQETLVKSGNATVSPSLSTSSTSGIFSPSSPSSCGSGASAEDASKPSCTANDSMNDFINKFSKPKFLTKTPGQERATNRSLTAARLESNSSCPPIPEDDLGDDNNKIKTVTSERCTNTWV